MGAFEEQKEDFDNIRDRDLTEAAVDLTNAAVAKIFKKFF